ncbi:ribonuclease HII [Candidatus Parcubacteria bacterium]|nr:ribonuclease HII [Candidatus Parcubacteria bacterium]
MQEFILGVDEAGRGPLAGPVAVGVVQIPLGFDVRKEFPGVTDSKLLSRQKREEIFIKVERRASRGDLSFVVRFSDHAHIDSHGIVHAVREAVWTGIKSLSAPSHAFVMLDGLLKAPKAYAQQTYIAGDLRVPVISLASICAKVTRDRLMEQMSILYPDYGFEAHKGYGTLEHRRAIQKHGLCAIHRRSYCKVV